MALVASHAPVVVASRMHLLRLPWDPCSRGSRPPAGGAGKVGKAARTGVGGKRRSASTAQRPRRRRPGAQAVRRARRAHARQGGSPRPRGTRGTLPRPRPSPRASSRTHAPANGRPSARADALPGTAARVATSWPVVGGCGCAKAGARPARAYWRVIAQPGQRISHSLTLARGRLTSLAAVACSAPRVCARAPAACGRIAARTIHRLAHAQTMSLRRRHVSSRAAPARCLGGGPTRTS